MYLHVLHVLHYLWYLHVLHVLHYYTDDIYLCILYLQTIKQ